MVPVIRIVPLRSRNFENTSVLLLSLSTLSNDRVDWNLKAPDIEYYTYIGVYFYTKMITTTVIKYLQSSLQENSW